MTLKKTWISLISIGALSLCFATGCGGDDTEDDGGSGGDSSTGGSDSGTGGSSTGGSDSGTGGSSSSGGDSSTGGDGGQGGAAGTGGDAGTGGAGNNTKTPCETYCDDWETAMCDNTVDKVDAYLTTKACLSACDSFKTDVGVCRVKHVGLAKGVSSHCFHAQAVPTMVCVE